MHDENSFMEVFTKPDSTTMISITFINCCSCTEKFSFSVKRHRISYAPRLVFNSGTNSKVNTPEKFHHRGFV
jgi:hypothetical protein